MEVSVAMEGRGGGCLQPGCKEKENPPYFFNLVAKARAKRIFADFDCPYASHSS